MQSIVNFWEKQYLPANLRAASLSSLTLWTIALKGFERSLGRPATLSDLTDENVAEFARYRRQNVSAATVNRDLASLLALWRFAAKLGKVKTWPTVQLEKEPRRVPVAWLQEEFNQLMRTVSRLDGKIGEHDAAAWWRALLLVCFDTAERISAVLDLEWSNVDLRTRWVLFPAETRKGRVADSICPIAQDTVEALEEIRRPRGNVFHWPLNRNYVWKRYGAILEAAGLPNDRKRKFHCVRRTVASYVEANGGNATEVLRHASRHTTMAYLDPRIVKPSSAIDRMWRPDK